MKNIFLSFALLITLLLAQQVPVNAGAAQADQGRSALAGQKTFEENCMRCHGGDGAGNTFVGHKWKIPDLRSDAVQRQSAEQLIQIIADGKNDKMPSHKDKLSATEIRQVEEYLRDLAKKQPISGQ